MNIEFVARHLDLDDALRAFAEKKIAKTAKFLEEPADVQLVLEAEKHRRIAELRVKHRFGHHQATEEDANDFRDAITVVTERVERQLRRSRKKFLDKRRRGSARLADREWPVEVLEKDTVSSGKPEIIKVSRLEIRPMRLEEAAETLESSNNEFVVFVNPETEQINVLYKRHDEHYGLIAQD